MKGASPRTRWEEETRKTHEVSASGTSSLVDDASWAQPPTYPDVKHRADGLVVAGLQGHVALVAQLSDVLPLPEDPVTPGGSATLLAETQSPR